MAPQTSVSFASSHRPNDGAIPPIAVPLVVRGSIRVEDEDASAMTVRHHSSASTESRPTTSPALPDATASVFHQTANPFRTDAQQ